LRWGFETAEELARAKVSKLLREKFAETKVNQQALSKVYSCALELLEVEACAASFLPLVNRSCSQKRRKK
jgi:hypothetical protein